MLDEIENKKPRFYMADLNNYMSEFLQEIIIWQNIKIKELETKIELLKKSSKEYHTPNYKKIDDSILREKM